MNKILSPEDELFFGKYKGKLLSDIYNTNHIYIEWLMKNVSFFIIDVDAFYSLPNPTPINYHTVKTFITINYQGFPLLEIEPSLLKIILSSINEDYKSKSFFISQILIPKIINDYTSREQAIQMLYERKIIIVDNFKFPNEAVLSNETKIKIVNSTNEHHKDYKEETYGSQYSQFKGYNGFSDDVIRDAFEGDPSLTWNID